MKRYGEEVRSKLQMTEAKTNKCNKQREQCQFTAASWCGSKHFQFRCTDIKHNGKKGRRRRMKTREMGGELKGTMPVTPRRSEPLYCHLHFLCH